MKTVIVRLGRMLVLAALGIAASVLYGILNNQITVSLSPEFFSVIQRNLFHHALKQTGLLDAPIRVQAAFIGMLTTWWFGLLLSVVLSTNRIFRRSKQVSIRHYLWIVGGIMLCTLCSSVVFGTIGYLAEPGVNLDYWPLLDGIEDVRSAFAVGCWHNGAYVGASIATLVAAIRMRTVTAKI